MTTANYKALLIRRDARDKVDEARIKFTELKGYVPTYSSLIQTLCEEFIANVREREDVR